MTADLRSHALEAGWHPDVVAHMHVEHNNGEFSVKVHPDYHSRAFTHEYGDETARPTAVIRKYSNNNGHTSQVFKAYFSKNFGGNK